MSPADTTPTTVLDCTLRDGGYYNNWDFAPDLVAAYLNVMRAISIDAVEIGFRTFPKSTFLGAHAFSSDDYLRSLSLPENARICVMINAADFIGYSDGPRGAVERLFAPAAKSPVDLVRVATHFHELAKAGQIIESLHEMGYGTTINLMQSGSRTTEEITDAVRTVSEWPVDVLYCADSLGNMEPKTVRDLLGALKSDWPGEIGFHAHDSMLRALPNSVAALNSGATWIDATVLGMGRGPGNVRLEYLLLEMNRLYGTSYDGRSLFNLLEEYFKPLQAKYGWGPHPFYYMSGAYEIHPTYVQELLGDGRYLPEEILDALEFLKEKDVHSYSVDTLRQAARPYDIAAEGTWDASGWAKGKAVLLVAATEGSRQYREAIVRFIDRTSPMVIALNVTCPLPSDRIDAWAACYPTRIMMEFQHYSDLRQPLILPAAAISDHVRESISRQTLFDYGLRVVEDTFAFEPTGCTVPKPLVAAYALAFATSASAETILLAGFDGYGPSDPLQAEMAHIFEQYQQTPNSLPLLAITPTTYPLPQSSVFAPDL